MCAMTNRAYDILKWVALVALPAVATFYAAVAAIWQWPYPTEVVGTITAVNALLGALLGISSAVYREPNHTDVSVRVEQEPNLPTNFGGTNRSN